MPKLILWQYCLASLYKENIFTFIVNQCLIFFLIFRNCIARAFTSNVIVHHFQEFAFLETDFIKIRQGTH